MAWPFLRAALGLWWLGAWFGGGQSCQLSSLIGSVCHLPSTRIKGSNPQTTDLELPKGAMFYRDLGMIHGDPG